MKALMTTQQEIRRHADGSIDIGSYRKQALAERATSFRPGKHRFAKTLIALAMMLASAGTLVVGSVATAGVIHIVTNGISTAVAAASSGR
jgi:hypothetical protein